MPVDSQHPEYTEYFDKWQRCNDVADGQDAIHQAGTLYLPKLSDQTAEEYQAYLKRTPFYNAFWRTLVGLQGMLFRKPPEIVLPPSVEKLMEDVTLDGTPMHLFALELSEEILKLGRVGVFVDYPIVDTETTTKADALAMNLRPLLKMYDAESIINWRTRVINNATVLSMVVLRECVDVRVDEFSCEEETQYRVLDLVDLVWPDGVVRPTYRVRVIKIEDKDGKKVETTISNTFPQIDGKYLESIPFQFIGIDDVNWCVDEPPLIDLVDMNLSHFRTSADYEHGCHFTGLPTPVVSGYTPEKQGEKFVIGSLTAWVFPRPDAKANFLEFKGEGLGALERNLAKKEANMAVLGARMLEVQTRAVESAKTASIHRSGEQSMLSSVAQSISIAVTKVLKVFCKFAGADDTNVKFELNRDFFPVPMDSLTVTAIIAAWQNGAMSYETMFRNLQRGEIFRPEDTPETEQQAIKDNPAPLPVAGTTPGSPSPNAPKTAASGTGANPTITQLQHK